MLNKTNRNHMNNTLTNALQHYIKHCKQAEQTAENIDEAHHYRSEQKEANRLLTELIATQPQTDLIF